MTPESIGALQRKLADGLARIDPHHRLLGRPVSYRVIDGREEVRGHGTRDMPLWGLTFRIGEGGDEDAVKGRIWQLIYYLQTLQEE